MANEEHLNMLKRDIEAWNKWRLEHKDTRPELSGAYLPGAFLSTADLSSAELRGAYLSEAHLNLANLSGADLSNTDLSRVNLRNANLEGANLKGANLSRADLNRANLSGAHMIRADLSRADLSRAVLSEANLKKADLSRADLSQTNLSGSELNEADLSGAYLNGTDLTNVDLEKARCRKTIFADIDLSTTKNLEAINHAEPSTIGIDTLLKSHGKVPEIFLRGCGVPENLLVFLPAFVEGKVILTAQNSIFGILRYEHRPQFDVFVMMPLVGAFQPIYEDHIKAAVQSLGHTIRRGDDFFGKGSSMTDSWSSINNAKLIIADCTGRSPIVFHGLGIAQSLDKAIIMTTQSIDDIPSDIRHLSVIKYANNPRDITKFEVALKSAIHKLLDS